MRISCGIALSLVLIASVACFSDGSPPYYPKGPSDTLDFEVGLHERYPGCELGIFPREEILASGVPSAQIPAEHMTEIKTWLNHLLAPSLRLPEYDHASWVGLRDFRGQNMWGDDNFIVGAFTAADATTLVQFQARGMHIGLTFHSQTLFNLEADQMTESLLRSKITTLLAFPSEKVPSMIIEKEVDTVAGIPFCQGVVRCEWDGPGEPWFDAHWWNHMSYWYVKGKLWVLIRTLEWKEDTHPASPEEPWPF